MISTIDAQNRRAMPCSDPRSLASKGRVRPRRPLKSYVICSLAALKSSYNSARPHDMRWRSSACP